MVKTALTRKQKSAQFPTGYNVTVTGRHVHVTDYMKSYAREKLAKLEHVGNRIINIHLIMDIQKLAHTVEIIMKYGQTTFRSAASTTDMYVSIDQAVDKIEKQILKYKKQLKGHHGKEYPVVQEHEKIYRPLSTEAFLNLSEVDEHEVNDILEAEEIRELSYWAQPHEIVRFETQPLSILSDEEAIAKVDRSKKALMLYLDERTRKLKVIYRQKDGNFGVIESE